MISILRTAGLASFIAFLVSGCAPPGQSDAKVGLLWPRADQLLSATAQTEIEALLRRLGYFKGTVDGAITASTRVAIKQYQQAVGAPPNGVVSETLLTSLRSTAGVRTITTQPAPKTSPAPKTTRPPSTRDTGTDDGGDTDGGGGGGDPGGSAWG